MLTPHGGVATPPRDENEGFHAEVLLNAEAWRKAIFNSTHFTGIATDTKGIIQLFNVGAERMLGYAAADVLNKVTPADICDVQEVAARARALSVELGILIHPGVEALLVKASCGVEDIYPLTYIGKNGSRHAAVVSVTALRNTRNALIGYFLLGNALNDAPVSRKAAKLTIDAKPPATARSEAGSCDQREEWFDEVTAVICLACAAHDVTRFDTEFGPREAVCTWCTHGAMSPAQIETYRIVRSERVKLRDRLEAERQGVATSNGSTPRPADITPPSERKAGR